MGRPIFRWCYTKEKVGKDRVGWDFAFYILRLTRTALTSLSTVASSLATASELLGNGLKNINLPTRS